MCSAFVPRGVPVSLQCPGGWPHSPVPEVHLESGALAEGAVEVHPCSEFGVSEDAQWSLQCSGGSRLIEAASCCVEYAKAVSVERRDVSRTRIPRCWSVKILQSPASGGLTSALPCQT